MDQGKRRRRPCRPPTQAELDKCEQGWQEIGGSLAALVANGDKNETWAWNLVGPLGLYKKWMLREWIRRAKEELTATSAYSPPPAKRMGRPKTVKNKDESVFTKKDQINLALRLLEQGKTPVELYEHFSKTKPNG